MAANPAAAADKARFAVGLAVQKAALASQFAAEKANLAARLAAQKAFQSSILAAQKNAAAAGESYSKRQHDKEMLMLKQSAKAADQASKAKIRAAKESVDPVTAAIDRIRKADERAAATEQAKAALGKTTMAQEKQAADAATSAANNAAASEAAEATAIGAVTAVALAAAAAIAALVVVTGSLAAKAIEIVQQRAGLLATFSALGGGAIAGKATLAMVDKLSEKLPLPAAQIAEIAKQMESAGFRGKALGKGIEAVAAATAIMHSESGGAAAQKMLKTLAEGGLGAQKMADQISKGGAKSNKLLADMGLSANDVTKALRQMGVKGKASADQVGMAVEKALASKAGGKGGPLAEMGATFPVILAKLQEGFASLFEGVKIGPFMASVKNLFGQFSRGAPAMKALKPIVTEVFGTLFKYATLGVTWVSKLVAKMATGKNIAGTWNEVKAAIAKVVSVLGVVWATMKPIVTSTAFVNGLVTIFKVLAVVVALVGAALAGTTAILVGLAGAVGMVGTFLWSLIGTVVSFGASIVEGLLNFDYSAFVAKMVAMATAGLDAFKAVLGIASPSAVMAEMGGHVAAGAAVGVEGGSGKAVASAGKMGADMATGAGKGASKGGAGAGAGKGGGKSITIESGALVIHAGGAVITEEMFASIMERLLATQGG